MTTTGTGTPTGSDYPGDSDDWDDDDDDDWDDDDDDGLGRLSPPPCATSSSTRSLPRRIWCSPGGLRRLFPHDKHAGAGRLLPGDQPVIWTPPMDAALREKLDGVGPPGEVPPAVLRR